MKKENQKQNEKKENENKKNQNENEKNKNKNIKNENKNQKNEIKINEKIKIKNEKQITLFNFYSELKYLETLTTENKRNYFQRKYILFFLNNMFKLQKIIKNKKQITKKNFSKITPILFITLREGYLKQKNFRRNIGGEINLYINFYKNNENFMTPEEKKFHKNEINLLILAYNINVYFLYTNIRKLKGLYFYILKKLNNSSFNAFLSKKNAEWILYNFKKYEMPQILGKYGWRIEYLAKF